MIVGRRISVIDIGSNSVRLLVADVNSQGINEIYRDLNTTRLYKDISDDYILDKDSMNRTVDAIAKFVDIANDKSSDEIYMFATAAVRVAKNKDDFINRVKKTTRIILEVITEKKEAEMAFAGVDCNGVCGVVDIGGASTEIAIGAGRKIISASSAKVGAVKCKEALKSDKDKDEIISFIDSILIPQSTNTIGYSKKQESIKWYGVGGTITTMAAMINELEKYDSTLINQTKISYNDIEVMIERLQKIDIEKRKQLSGLQPKRADIIVYGLCILQTVMRNCNISYICASDNDNLAGYIKLLIKEI